GNVSFYNQTGDVPIHPTPVVAVLGVIDDVADRIPSGWQDEGNNIYLLGITRDELDGSAWAGVIHSHLGGRPPIVDFAAEQALAGLIRSGSEQNIIASAHDLSDGGLIQAVSESVLRFGVGARLWITELMERDDIDATAAFFSESGARMIVSVPREDDVRFIGLCEGRGVPFLRVGVTDGTDLEVQDQFTLTLEELRETHRGTLARHFGPVVGS
ncbi:MAG: phosphoribosylformylglycinamidine synthase II, partial [Candidatus Saccharibacteria bacterium]|nr:phosphoribosylformylglycinamidine synthase II [Microbacteriaceae bacterium]